MTQRTHHKKTLVSLICLFAVLFSVSANAGLFNTLSKISKNIKTPDVDIPLHKLELPDAVKDFTPVSLKPDADGHWSVTDSDGSVVSLEALLNKSTAGAPQHALLIRSMDLPDELRQFDKLPKDLPVFIRGKKNRLFELHRGATATVSYKRVALRVDNVAQLRDAMWMLQRPAKNRGVRFIKLGTKAADSMPAGQYPFGYAVGTASVGKLLRLMSSISNQTLVLSGRIIDGQLHVAGKNSVSVPMKKLQQLAAERDIHLVVLDSDHPDKLLKKMANSMQRAANDKSLEYDSVGDFFNRLANPANSNKLELQLTASGEHQVAVQLRSRRVVAEGSVINSGVLDQMPAHVLLHSAMIYHPDKARSRELDDRIIPGIPSLIQFYVLVSVVLGFTALGTSWMLWKKIWLLRGRREYDHLVIFLLLWPVHRLLFLLLFLPTLGLFSFIWLVLALIYKVFDWLLIRPSLFLYRLIAR